MSDAVHCVINSRLVVEPLITKLPGGCTTLDQFQTNGCIFSTPRVKNMFSKRINKCNTFVEMKSLRRGKETSLIAICLLNRDIHLTSLLP